MTLGSALSAALASWVVNGGNTTLYYKFGQHGVLWALLEASIVILTDESIILV